MSPPDYTDDELFAMSDDALEAAYNEAIAATDSAEDADAPEPEESDVSEDTSSEEVSEEDVTQVAVDETAEQESGESTDPETDAAETDPATAEKEEDAEKLVEENSTHTFTVDGKEYEMTSEELVDKFPDVFSQAMSYKKSVDTLKPWRKTVDALQTAQVAHDDVNLMIDALKGDKAAIAEVVRRNNIDINDIDVDQEGSFKPKEYGRDASVIEVKDVIDSLQSDTQFAVTERVLTEWDADSWQVMASAPEKIRLLHEDVKSGLYDKLQPIAEKLRVFDRGSKTDLEYYAEAANEYAGKQAAQAEAKIRAQKQADAARVAEEARVAEAAKRAEEVAAKRKAAAPTKKAAPSAGIVDDSDEAFEIWLKSIEEKM